MNGEHLGKIVSVKFGELDNGLFGLEIEMMGPNWGTTWRQTAATGMGEQHIKLNLRIISLLKDAKITDVYQLKNKPIIASFDGSFLKDWRILTEVL